MTIGLEELMLRMPYICLLILLTFRSVYQTIWFGLMCAVFTFLVMSVVCRWRLRKVAKATRARFDERSAQRIRFALELLDTILQTIQGSRFVIEVALEKSDDTANMRLALEKLSSWLAQATQDAQQALNSLSTVEKTDD